MEIPTTRIDLPPDLPAPLAEAARFLTVAAPDRSADLLDAVLAHAPVILFVLDGDGRVVPPSAARAACSESGAARSLAGS